MNSDLDDDRVDPSRTTRPRSQTDVVVDGIKNMITSGVLRAGSRLPIEKDLAHELGVSRGPLREAVRALSIIGVLETRQGDGTYVTSLEPSLLLAPVSFMVDLRGASDGSHLQSVRRVLETEAAGRAALTIDEDALAEAEAILASVEPLVYATGEPDYHAIMEADIAFHRVVARASANPALEALIEALAPRTIEGRMWRAMNEQGAVRATHAEHRAILRSLSAHDPDSSRLRMAVHLLAVQDSMRNHPSSSATSARDAAQ
ncbi:MAG TPA: FCD domain-containing protein [Propionibacteriaceae bacterium]|nr:FCD domain-containing protein [Coriobacteriia bacterium]